MALALTRKRPGNYTSQDDSPYAANAFA
jgi:hypothetical protein